MNLYIKKEIESDNGVDENAHFPAEIIIRLNPLKKQTGFVQNASIMIRSYVNQDKYNESKGGNDRCKQVQIEDITTLACYQAVVQSAIGAILADPQFAGAVIADADEVAE